MSKILLLIFVVLILGCNKSVSYQHYNINKVDSVFVYPTAEEIKQCVNVIRGDNE